MIKVSKDTKFNKPMEVSQSRLQQLEKYTNAGIEYQKKNDSNRLALCVYLIYTNKLFLEAGFKNIYDYCKEHFNIERGTTSNYVNVAKKFLDSSNGRSIFAQGNADFSFIAMIELKSLSPDDIRYLLNNGKITLGCTANEAKTIAKEYKDYKKEQARLEAEGRKAPIIEAYEAYNKAFNELKNCIPDSDTKAKDLLQKIMDNVVILYNNNDRLWET